MADTLDYFVPNAAASDVRKRLKAYEELVEYLRNDSSSLRCQDMEKLIDALCCWVNSSNFKVGITFVHAS